MCHADWKTPDYGPALAFIAGLRTIAQKTGHPHANRSVLYCRASVEADLAAHQGRR